MRKTMSNDEGSEKKTGDPGRENMYANLKDLQAHTPENNPKAQAVKTTQDRLTLILVMLLIVMFLILVIFTSLVFVYYEKIMKEVAHVMSSAKQCTSSSDKLEQCKNGTQPFCEAGWLVFDGQCYFISDFTLNWTQAMMMCLNRESHLVIITSEAEQKFLLNHIHGNVEYWIGMTDMEMEGTNRWVDGTLSSSSQYQYWYTGEPNNYGGNEDCIALSRSNKWNDVQCSSINFAICEKRLI